MANYQHRRSHDDRPTAHRRNEDYLTAGPSIFLCLSGGGLRAALFHYGCFKRLHEVGLLGHVYAISATSGGAISAALLACYQGRSDAEKHICTYRWAEFETAFLRMATRGLLERTTFLIIVYGFHMLWIAAAFIRTIGGPVPLSVILLLLEVALVLHISLGADLISEKTYRHSYDEQIEAEMLYGERLRPISPQSLSRTMKMLFAPSHLRLEAMNAMLFRGGFMRGLPGVPRLYLNTVNLNDGRQKVFGQGGLADLDSTGCRFLWELETDDECKYLTLAAAVAASSAIPLFFHPVSIRGREKLLGVFVDGGVADNLALSVPKALAVHIHPDRGQRFRPDGGGLMSFQSSTSYVLIADGSMPLAEKHNRSWSRLLSLKRVTDSMMNQQMTDAATTALTFARNARVPTAIASLQFGMPDHVADSVPVPANVLRRVRTHLDAFNLQECAVLAYCGYSLIEQWLRENPDLLDRYEGARKAKCLEFREILPEAFRKWDADASGVQRTLRYSNFRFSPVRWIGRKLGW